MPKQQCLKGFRNYLADERVSERGDMASLGYSRRLASVLQTASLDRIKLAQHRAQHRFEIDIDRLYAAQTRLLAQYLTDEAALHHQ